MLKLGSFKRLRANGFFYGKMDGAEDFGQLPDRRQPPASASVSIKSDASMEGRHNFNKEAAESSGNFEKPDSAVSTSVSMKSDASMEGRHSFTLEATERDHYGCSESTEMDPNILFKVETHVMEIVQSDLRRYKKMLFPDIFQSSASEKQDAESLTMKDKNHDNGATEGVLMVTLRVLKEMGQKALASELERHIYGELDVCQRKLRHKLRKFQYIYEGVAQHGNQTLLNKVYTELYITEGVSGTVNNEHEVRQIEAANRRPAEEEKPIKCEDIFKSLHGQDRVIRTALTIGIAGIGKTISVQKFNVEWAEGRVNQDVQLLINLPFRELNLISCHCSLTQLLHHFLAEAKESGISNFDKYKLVLIFDGLDECRLALDFHHNKLCCSVSEPASVDVLMTNLIKGNLLPSAHIWITSRPAAAHRIPIDLVDRLTEIRGFNDPQKDEYFRKKIPDQNMASRVIAHIKATRSLHIMCHIPVFSWMSATVLQRILKEAEMEGHGNTREMPNTLTQMYTNFLVYNSLIKTQKYLPGEEASETQFQVRIGENMILKLGKLAFKNLIKGNMIFYEYELREYNININDAAVYSGVFTQMSENDFGFGLERVFCFVHLSIQEFFAAMYIYHSFIRFNQNLLEPEESTADSEAPSEVTSLLKSAVDKALQSNNGNLDLFLRFLLGLSQTTNQSLLKSILTTMEIIPQRNEEIIEYIKEKIRQNPSPERCINLFHCLIELNDQSLLEETQNYLSSGSLPETKLTPSQWAALVFVLLTSKETLVEFDLRKYSRSEEGVLRLLPVIKESRVAVLKECNLTWKCCENLATILGSSILCLKELDLSDNDLQDSGIMQLSFGLASPECQLEKLRLQFCGITENGCDFLAQAVMSNPAHLKELDLSYNHPGTRGIELLSAVQKNVDSLTINFSSNAECFLKSALKKYECKLTLDPNTAHSHLSFSEDNKTMTRMETAQPYPDNPERFTDWGQVLCKEALTGRCYWEVEWTGEWTGIGVAYRGILKKDDGNFRPVFGYNNKSWGLRYYQGKYTAWYNNNATVIVPYFNFKRVGVFLDWATGTLSFYAVSPNAMTHLHTFNAEFSEPLYPGFRLGFANTSLSLQEPERPFPKT
ncbi:NACHT, LRR and PYD domains-containing protein 14-like isoform X2 [Echeneis naucrates]|uniref:NACHT, LRR and PYD domains-containing protein 14-like isoform X2 n=1 Tax=Echeneis naucrates TaxID=173247 RepID=UPI0011140AE2|nr:NACHT, LRR and PYD domains-containing protein 14-like isoform X2 [Echeneis naucrates]